MTGDNEPAAWCDRDVSEVVTDVVVRKGAFTGARDSTLSEREEGYRSFPVVTGGGDEAPAVRKKGD